MPVQPRFRPRLAALTAGLLLAGCAAPPPVAPPLGAPGDVPAETQAQPQTQPGAPMGGVSDLALRGVASLVADPFADAAVSAYVAGEQAAIATARTAADGTFALAIPPAHSGRLLRIVASRGTTSLVGAAMFGGDGPMQRRVAQVAEVRLTLGSTLAFLTLASRYTAVAGLGLNPTDRRAAIAALEKATAAAQAAVRGLTPQETDTLLAGLGPNGDGDVPPALAPRLAPRGGELATALIDAAHSLNALLKTGSGGNGAALSVADLERVVFAGSLLNSAGSGGGSNLPGGSLSVGASDAVFTGNTNPVGASATHPSGAVSDAYQLSGTPAAMVADGSDGMWVASTTANGYAIVHLTPSKATTKVVRATSAAGATAVTMATDGQGGVWVAAAAHGTVVHVTDSGATSHAVGGQPATMVADGDGGVWVGDGAAASVAHVSDTAIAPVALTAVPRRMAVDDAGRLWLQDGVISQIFSVVGTVVTPECPASGDATLVSGGADAVWFTLSGTNYLVRYVPVSLTFHALDLIAPWIVAGDGGRAWVQAGDGLRLYDGVNPPATVPIAFTPVHAVSDGAGGLWCTTATGAVHVAAPPGTGQVTTALGGAPTLVSADGEQDGWFALANGMVYEVAK